MMLLLAAVVVTFLGSIEASSELDNIKKLALANNELAFKLHKAFDSHGNAFTSPASIFSALAMLSHGAKGVTAEELHRTLSYSAAGLNDENINQHFQELLSLLGSSSDEYKLNIANAIVAQNKYPILQEYKDDLKKYYGAILKEVDFSGENRKALEEINNWINDKTQGKIPKLLNSLDRDTVLVLLNAVYFKGTWKTQFSPSNTREQTFYNDGVNAVSVPMMGAKNSFLYGDFKEEGVKAVKIPYKGEEISMVILLPYEWNGLSKVEQDLTPRKLDAIISRMREETIFLNIPKFKMEDQKDLKRNLTSLGMASAFSNGANFGGIVREGNLKVSRIVHKAVVEVNEEGSEAAGATALLIIPYSSAYRIESFLANHPFLFFIRDDRTGMILFYGRVNRL